MKLPRWRKEQNLRHRRKFTIFSRFIFLLIFLAILLPAVFFVIKEIKSSSLPKDFRQTIVLATNPILIISFSKAGDLTIVSIPENAYVEFTHGFGSYRLGAAWQLGLQEKMGGRLLQETVQELLAVPVDGWIGPVSENGKWKMENGKDGIINLKNSLTYWTIFLKPRELLETLKSLETNLTFFDLVSVWWQVKFTRFDKIVFINLGETSALSKLKLADGSEAQTIDQSQLDRTLQGRFTDQKIINEHLLIEVLNSTDKPGLANRVSRLINNLGGRVVSLTNIAKMTKSCQLQANNQARESFTAKRLSQVFTCQGINGQEDSRADLQIIIGSDYGQKLYQRLVSSSETTSSVSVVSSSAPVESILPK